jgi:hypothetical protein
VTFQRQVSDGRIVQPFFSGSVCVLSGELLTHKKVLDKLHRRGAQITSADLTESLGIHELTDANRLACIRPIKDIHCLCFVTGNYTISMHL